MISCSWFTKGYKLQWPQEGLNRSIGTIVNLGHSTIKGWTYIEIETSQQAYFGGAVIRFCCFIFYCLYFLEMTEMSGQNACHLIYIIKQL